MPDEPVEPIIEEEVIVEPVSEDDPPVTRRQMDELRTEVAKTIKRFRRAIKAQRERVPGPALEPIRETPPIPTPEPKKRSGFLGPIIKGMKRR